MAGGKKKNPPQKGDESYAERFDARYDDSPEVGALPPSLLTEWRANREALEGQNHLKAPNRLQNGLSSIHRTGLWFFCGTQNVLLPNGAGLPDPDAITAWLARNQATKKSRGNTKKTAVQTEAQNYNWTPSDPSLVQCAILWLHWRVRTAGGAVALLIVN